MKKAEVSKQQRRRETAPLLYDRATTAHLLSVSVAKVIRLEMSGQLVPVKLGGLANGKTLYRSEDVHRLAGIEQAPRL